MSFSHIPDLLEHRVRSMLLRLRILQRMLRIAREKDTIIVRYYYNRLIRRGRSFPFFCGPSSLRSHCRSRIFILKIPNNISV